MTTAFSNFIGSFFGIIADFLMAEPIIYFVCCFILILIIQGFKMFIKIR